MFFCSFFSALISSPLLACLYLARSPSSALLSPFFGWESRAPLPKQTRKTSWYPYSNLSNLEDLVRVFLDAANKNKQNNHAVPRTCRRRGRAEGSSSCSRRGVSRNSTRTMWTWRKIEERQTIRFFFVFFSPFLNQRQSFQLETC